MSKPTNADLKAQISALQEKLYTHGIEERPTIMSDIRNIEHEATQAIVDLKIACENQTGRTLNLSALCNSISYTS